MVIRPVLGLFAIVVLSLLFPRNIGTGTEVSLNPATVVSLALSGLLLLQLITSSSRGLTSRSHIALGAFLAMGLLSLVIGQLIWDPAVPQKASFWLVQMAQWSIFAIAGGLYLLASIWISDEFWLRRLSWCFLI